MVVLKLGIHEVGVIGICFMVLSDIIMNSTLP